LRAGAFGAALATGLATALRAEVFFAGALAAALAGARAFVAAFAGALAAGRAGVFAFDVIFAICISPIAVRIISNLNKHVEICGFC
jgi:hypothetical protein